MTNVLIWVAGGFFLLTSLVITAFLTTPVCFLAGPGTDYPRVQDAIRAAQAGCTVILLAGEYRENIVITKPIRLISRSHVTFAFFTQGSSGGVPFAVFSAPPRPITIVAADPQRPAIEIRAEGVELRGLQIRGGSHGILVSQTRRAHLIDNRISNSSQAGIALINAHESTLQNNEISQTSTGILLENSHQNHLVSNQMKSNARGLVLRGSRENEIRANKTLANQAEGIMLEFSNQNELVGNQSERNALGLVILSSNANTLRANRLDRNPRSLRVWGDVPTHFVHQIERSNTIDGRPVYYLVGEKDITISSRDQPAFVALINSERITVEGVTLSNGAEGIVIVNTQNSKLQNNVLLNTIRGIYVWNSRELEISGNRMERTEESGITLMGSQGIRVLRNLVLASGSHGVLLQNSSGNELNGNQLEGNRESGARLEASRKVTLAENQIRNNWVGVFLEQGGANVIKENWIRESQFGIFVHQSSDNQFADNRLENNRHDTNTSEQPPPPPPKPAPSTQPSSGGS